MRMAKPTGTLKLSLDEVSQTINLSEIAGVDLSNDPSLVNQIGQDIIDYMVARVQDGKGIGGVTLKAPYSKDYLSSDIAKAYDKKADPINMTLTGDMLGSIDLVNDDADKLKIAIDGSDVDTKKAYNHNVGDTVPRRPFFGVDKSELEDILAAHQDDIQAIKDEKANTKQSILDGLQQQSLIDIINNVNFLGSDV